jgi:hypothetical protein
MFVPERVMVCGVLLWRIGRKRTIHRPLLAMVVSVRPANLTVTFSPSPAVPQTGTGMPRCNTAPSLNNPCGLTSAQSMDCMLWMQAKMHSWRIIIGISKVDVVMSCNWDGLNPEFLNS